MSIALYTYNNISIVNVFVFFLKLERKDSELESHKRADIEELRTLMSKWVAKRVCRVTTMNNMI